MNSEPFRTITRCRACGGSELSPYLDFGLMPLANRLVASDETATEPRYPLAVVFCQECALSQLSVVVDPAVMFRHYVYRSSISNTFRRHCADLAQELHHDRRILAPGELVIDIASNDGTLLREFKAHGSRVLGVDPAQNLAKTATESGVETLPEFWGEAVAGRIRESHGPAKCIIATNVFAHVDDMHGFLIAAELLITDDGWLIIESPHMEPLLANTEFDTVYHEHLSYLLARPVDRLVRQHGMRITSVEKTPIHGGSIRFYIRKAKTAGAADASVKEVLDAEERAGLFRFETYAGFAARAEAVKHDLHTMLLELRGRGKRIAAYGASAKGNTLLNYCGIGPDILECIFDDTTEKHFKLSPGTRIPIVPGAELAVRKPDYLLLLAWNFAAELMEKTDAHRRGGGRYIVPIPSPRVL
jgi:novobiocin biosynthesis protein NovU/D-mycarose 3-C-methyltransferase